jgi:DNA-binding NarL/FixJ family response regulator
MNVVALVIDLADRMTIGEAVRFVRTADALVQAVAESDCDLVLVDLTLPGALDALAHLDRRVIAFGPHVDGDALTTAQERGAEAMPRSRFFREQPWRS